MIQKLLLILNRENKTKSVMENSVTKMIAKVKNHNKIYSLIVFWTLWLLIVVNPFSGTEIALITFFIGFCGSLLGIAYITEHPNEKERKTMDKIYEYFKSK